MSCCGSACSGGKIRCLASETGNRQCLCQVNVNCLNRAECGNFRSRGTAAIDSCQVSCQCAEEEAWNKNIPPKPNCEWFSNFKELRRQWSNHCKQQTCTCYACSSYRKAAICQSCFPPVPSCSGNSILPPRDCQECCKDCPLRLANDSRPKDKLSSTSECPASNCEAPVNNCQNSPVCRPANNCRSYSAPRRSILKKEICYPCIPEGCCCQPTVKICNSRDERDSSSECLPPSRERRFPRNKIETSEKLCCSRCQLPDPKCLCCKCDPCSLPMCDQCMPKRCKISPAKSICCREDNNSAVNRMKPASHSKSFSCHGNSGVVNTFPEIGNDNCRPQLRCCCGSEIEDPRKENLNQQLSDNKNSVSPENRSQSPNCSSPRENPSPVNLTKLYKSGESDAERKDSLKNNSKSNFSPINSPPFKESNFDLKPSIQLKTFDFIESLKLSVSEKGGSEKFNKQVSNEKIFRNQHEIAERVRNSFMKLESTSRNGEQFKRDENIEHKSSLAKLENSHSHQEESSAGKKNAVERESSDFSLKEDKETLEKFTSCVLDSNKEKDESNEILLCVKGCGRYRKERRHTAHKFKLDLKEDILKSKASSSSRFTVCKNSQKFHHCTEHHRIENDLEDDLFEIENKDQDDVVNDNSNSTIFWSSNQSLIDYQMEDKNVHGNEDKNSDIKRNENKGIQENENVSGALEMKNLSSDVLCPDHLNIDTKTYTKNSPVDAANNNLNECSKGIRGVFSRQKSP